MGKVTNRRTRLPNKPRLWVSEGGGKKVLNAQENEVGKTVGGKESRDRKNRGD